MKDIEKRLEAIKEIADTSRADQLEISLFAKDYGLTRFAGNQIHQNMVEEDSIVTVRVFHNSSLGSCSTNKCDKTSISEAVDRALEIASLNKPVENFPGFAGEDSEEREESIEEEYPKLEESPYCKATAETDAKGRADIVGTILSTIENHGFEAAGAIENGTYVSSVTTSAGRHLVQKETSAKLNLVVNRPGQTGFGTGLARWIGRDISQLDPREQALSALKISKRNTDPVPLESGDYEVILSSEAVGLLLYYLSWMGFHSRAFHSGQSFMAGHAGEQVLDSKLSIYDDGLDTRGLAMPFDWEGRPKRKVDFIRNGIVGDVVYDSFTAAAAGKKSTGHALSLLKDRYYSSPLPTNLFIEPGEETIEEMISSSKKALLIHSFWYVREVHWGRAAVTGMTRDGTFFVEDGKITKALPDLRFNESIVEAFKRVISVGREVKLTDQYNGAAMVPPLKLARFNIAGAS